MFVIVQRMRAIQNNTNSISIKNTISTVFELWICGLPDAWYLMLVSVIRKLYEHPDAYKDYQHPGLTVVCVYTNRNEVMYARGGISENIGNSKNTGQLRHLM